MGKIKLDELERELTQRKRALEIKYLAMDAMEGMRSGASSRKEAQVLMGHMYLAKKDFRSAIYYIGRALEQTAYRIDKVTQPEFIMERAFAGIERIIEQVRKPETKIDTAEKYRVLESAVGLIKTYYPEQKTA